MRARLSSNAGRGSWFGEATREDFLQNSVIDPFLTSSTIWWKFVSMCLIFEVSDTPLDNLSEALLSLNKSGTAELPVNVGAYQAFDKAWTSHIIAVVA